MLVRRERRGDEGAIRDVHLQAFRPAAGDAPEARLVDELRTGPAWLPRLSLVAVDGEDVVGHVVCTRARLGPAEKPVLGLAPLGVRPARQGAGVGQALMHTVLGAADALDEPLVALVGDPRYYGRFGFLPAGRYGVDPPDPAWGDHFQLRALSAHDPTLVGPFRYAEPFDRL